MSNQVILSISEKMAQRNLRLIKLLSYLVGFRAYAGVLVIYLASVTGSYSLAMAGLAVAHISTSLFEVPTGILSDYIGRKKTLLLYFLTELSSIIFLAFASSTFWIFIATISMGLSMAVRSGAITAFVYENLEVIDKADEFSKYEGHRRALGKYSLATAGIVGTLLIYFIGIKASLFASLATSSIAFVLSFWLVDIKDDTSNKKPVLTHLAIAWQTFMGDTSLRDISFGKMLARGAGDVEYRLRSLFFAVIMPEWAVNLLNTANSLISGIGMKYTHKIVKKFGIIESIVHIGILNRIVISCLIALNSVTSAIAMTGATALMHGVQDVATEDLLQQKYTKDQRATMGSIVGLGGSMVYATLAIAVGFLADSIGLLPTMLVLQVVLLIPILFFYKGLKPNKKQKIII